MKILVIGSGGREHAIAKKLKTDSAQPKVYCCPGNAGMLKDGIELVTLDWSDFSVLTDFVKKEGIDLTVVGPEQPLLEGIVDYFENQQLPIFGPKKEAALLEGSKAFAKEMMKRANIATADYQVFTDSEAASNYLTTASYPIVLKADGLAAGKGVIIAETQEVALATIQEMMETKVFGDSGNTVVIEEFLEGEEFTLMAFVDGTAVYPMIPAQDHKRAYEKDLGPNTGGMGAYAPVPQISNDVIEQSVVEVLEPMARLMVENGTPYHGILYAGLIVTKTGPQVIEFNARFGDPEAQVVLPLLDSSFVEVLMDLVNHRVPTVVWKKEVSFGVVIAREGYPADTQAAKTLPDISVTDTVNVYFSGVKEEKQTLLSDGGRVLLFQTNAKNFDEAKVQVYQAIDSSVWDGFFYRRDIGHKIK